MELLFVNVYFFQHFVLYFVDVSQLLSQAFTNFSLEFGVSRIVLYFKVLFIIDDFFLQFLDLLLYHVYLLSAVLNLFSDRSLKIIKAYTVPCSLPPLVVQIEIHCLLRRSLI